jgi:hypothetical protein
MAVNVLTITSSVTWINGRVHCQVRQVSAEGQGLIHTGRHFHLFKQIDHFQVDEYQQHLHISRPSSLFLEQMSYFKTIL